MHFHPYRVQLSVGQFVNLEGIPVLETGIEYPASTGPFTPTASMLLECVAAQADPHIVAPRIKIGHTDNPINSDLQELFQELNAGRDASEPALGTIQNMRVTDDGQTLIGDFYGLPEWLAAILETAYPARSIEGGAWKNGANNKEYDFCLEAVALLGVVGPGCTSLADLQELFSKEGPKVTVIEMNKSSKLEGGSVPRVVAQVNVEDIRRAFYDDFAQGDYYWWWDRELLIDPLEFIVQDPDEGQLYRLPVNVANGDGTDAVSFGEPLPVKVKYVPDKSGGKTDASRLIAPQLEHAGVVLAVNTTPPRERERQNRKETPHMAIDISALRTRLGLTAEQLPDDATEEQINAAFNIEVPPPEPEPAPEPEPDPVPEGERVPVAASVDPAVLAQLQEDARLGREARQQQISASRESFIDTHMAQGKFPPSSRASYLAQLARGGETETATRAFIEGLTPGLIPVGEVGGDDGGTQMSAAGDGGYIDSHLTDGERARIQAHRSGQPLPESRIISEA